MTKNEKKREVIAKIAKERGASLAVATHIYNCWPRKKQQYERANMGLKMKYTPRNATNGESI